MLSKQFPKAMIHLGKDNKWALEICVLWRAKMRQLCMRTYDFGLKLWVFAQYIRGVAMCIYTDHEWKGNLPDSLLVLNDGWVRQSAGFISLLENWNSVTIFLGLMMCRDF